MFHTLRDAQYINWIFCFYVAIRSKKRMNNISTDEADWTIRIDVTEGKPSNNRQN